MLQLTIQQACAVNGRSDSRIRLVRTGRKLGLAGSSNFVSHNARASVLARMDADDISHPDRLKRQWKIIEEPADVVTVRYAI